MYVLPRKPSGDLYFPNSTFQQVFTHQLLYQCKSWFSLNSRCQGRNALLRLALSRKVLPWHWSLGLVSTSDDLCFFFWSLSDMDWGVKCAGREFRGTSTSSSPTRMSPWRWEKLQFKIESTDQRLTTTQDCCGRRMCQATRGEDLKNSFSTSSLGSVFAGSSLMSMTSHGTFRPNLDLQIPLPRGGHLKSILYNHLPWPLPCSLQQVSYLRCWWLLIE